MTVRVFLRGGYQEIREPTIISSRGAALFTVFPGIRERGRASGEQVVVLRSANQHTTAHPDE